MLRRALRLVHIARVLVAHGLDELVFAIPFLRPVAFVHALLPWNWRRGPRPPRGLRIRRALEELDYFTSYLKILGTYPADRPRS